jgi:hypothetical protein
VRDSHRAFHYGRTEPIHALFVDHPHLAARIRAFVDFVAAKLASAQIGRKTCASIVGLSPAV